MRGHGRRSRSHPDRSMMRRAFPWRLAIHPASLASRQCPAETDLYVAEQPAGERETK